MDKIGIGWIWFALAIAALVTAVVAQGMAAFFYVLAAVFGVAGIVFLLKGPQP